MTKQQMRMFKARKVRILSLMANNVTQREIARMLKISPQRVCQIVNGKLKANGAK